MHDYPYVVDKHKLLKRNTQNMSHRQKAIRVAGWSRPDRDSQITALGNSQREPTTRINVDYHFAAIFYVITCYT
jgi:hypothetical protein